MIKTKYQILRNGMLKPQTQYDMDLVFEAYKPNQLVNVQITGGESARSVPENALFHLCCKKVADNCDDPQWSTPAKVKIQTKMILKFFKEEIWVDTGGVHFVLDTVEFSKTKQVRSHKFISEALELMANKLGVTVEQLTENAGR